MICDKKRPLVSVIIPTFNRDGILKEAVQSVLAQDFKDFELIVVDDGSTDKTRETLAGFGENIMVVHQENSGVSAARNRGIEASRGEYVALLDSDDLWRPGKLWAQVKFFRDNPKALICQTEEIWIRNGKRVNPKVRHKKPSGNIFERSLSLCLVSPSAVMMKASLLGEVGLFDEGLPACEDYDLWLRIGWKYPVFLIDEPLVVKTGGHPDQLSRQPGLDKYRILSLEKLLKSGNLDPKRWELAREKLVEKCRIYALGCQKRGKDNEARVYFSMEARYNKNG